MHIYIYIYIMRGGRGGEEDYFDGEGTAASILHGNSSPEENEPEINLNFLKVMEDLGVQARLS